MLGAALRNEKSLSTCPDSNFSLRASIGSDSSIAGLATRSERNSVCPRLELGKRGLIPFHELFSAISLSGAFPGRGKVNAVADLVRRAARARC